MYGYEDALKAVPGVNVFDFLELGSYQGEWYALIGYEGNFLVASGSYGSCSGCDAFEAEIGSVPNVEDAKYQAMVEFGRTYVESALPIPQALDEIDRTWMADDDKKKVKEWLSRDPYLVAL